MWVSNSIKSIINIFLLLLIDLVLQAIYGLIHNYYVFSRPTMTISVEAAFLSLVICAPILYFLVTKLLSSDASLINVLKDLFFTILIIIPGGLLLAVSQLDTLLILPIASAALWITYTVIIYARFSRLSASYIIMFIGFILYPIYFLWGMSNIAIDSLLVMLPTIQLLIVIIIGFKILKTWSIHQRLLVSSP